MTPFERAQRFVGVIEERGGSDDHPLILWWLSLCNLGGELHDEIPWCSAFVNGVMWDLRLPRSKSAAARSWLRLGIPIELDAARPGNDVVILNRGLGPRDPNLSGPGHVGFYAGQENGMVLILGGNQSNGVSVASFSPSRLLGVRRITA